MEARVLGPVELEVDGRPIRPTGARQRALVAVLVARRGRPVPASVLVDALWPDDPPRTAEHTLAAHVSRLRGLAGAAVTAVDGGYRLDLDDEHVDAARFEALVARSADRASRDAARGAAPDVGPDADPDPAVVERLRTALALWRGPAYGRAAELSAVRAEAVRLDEARTAAQEALAAALVRTGDPEAAVVVLEGVVAELPARERAWAALVRALVAAGRPADAARAAVRGVAALDELGLRPSADLRAAHTDALRDRPAPVPAAAPALAPAAVPVAVAAAVPAAVPAPGARGALRPSDAPGRAFPVPAGALVGRADDLVRVEQALERSRLVTLVGPGGVGKTRLALEAARRAAPRRAAGARLVDLTTVPDPGAVPAAVAAACGLATAPDGPEAALARASAVDVLVVLDNCEHVVDAAARVARLLARPGGAATVLATSRERLGVPGERALVVAPLGTGGPRSPARRLFLDRAAEVGADVADAADGDAVDRLVRALDGLPLALEMAAARCATVGVADLADQVAEHPDALGAPWREAPDRHRSLAALLASSVDLLDPDDRSALLAWPVFAGAVTAQDADAVLGPSPGRAPRLAGRSLLVLEQVAGRGRYRMLRTVRSALVDEHPVGDAARARHAAHFADVAARCDAALRTRDEARAAARLREVRAELRAAHRWARASDPGLAARLTRDLHLTTVTTLDGEVAGWAEELAALVADGAVALDPGAAAAVDTTRAALRVLAGDVAGGEALARRAVGTAGDDVAMPALEVLADAALYVGRLADATACGDRLVAAATARRDPHHVLVGWSFWVLEASYGGDHGEAAARLAHVRTELAGYELGPSDRGWLAYGAGEIASERDPGAALVQLDRAVTLADSVGNVYLGGIARTAASAALARHGEPVRALRAFDEVVRWWSDRADVTHLVTALRNLVGLLVRIGADERAAELWGAVAGPVTGPSFGAEQGRLDDARTELVRRLGDERFADLAARGRGTAPDVAARRALDDTSGGRGGSGARGHEPGRRRAAPGQGRSR